MSNKSEALQSFIANHLRINSDAIDMDSRLSWWNRGWIELRMVEPEGWRITPAGWAQIVANPPAAGWLQAMAQPRITVKRVNLPESRRAT